MRICGREQRGSVVAGAAMRGRRLLCVGVGVLALVTCCAPALAAPGAPSPEQLWRSYPLDPTRTSDAQRAPSSTHPRREAQPTASTASSQTTLWLGLSAALATILAAAAVVAVILTGRGRVLASRLREWQALIPSAELKPAWLGFVDAVRSFGAMLREEVGSLAGPHVEFATSAGPEPSGRRPQGGPKAQRAAVNRLKEKRRTADQDDVDLLKAKLRGTTPKRSVVPRRPRVTPIRAVTPETERCRIEWWRGYVKSEFYAQELRPDRSGSIVAASPAFRWSKPTPPSETLPHVASAHSTLVAQLKAVGWNVSGRGENWYALELERRPDRDSGAEREP
jgi:hypothetical protein